MDGHMKDDTDFKVGDIAIRKWGGRETYLVLEVNWVRVGAHENIKNWIEREIVISDCITNQVKTALAKYYCIFLA